jgi:exonuclease VII small subunit
MARTEDFGARLERLEHHFAELADAMNRPSTHPSADPLARISLAAWLKVSGPTFAVMVFGFTLLWNAQQTSYAQMLEITRTTGRLEGAIERLEGSMDRLEGSVEKLEDSMERLDGSIAELDDAIRVLSERVDRLES